MASRPVAETVAAIEAESADSARIQERRQTALLQALNWFANKGLIGETSTATVFALAKRYDDFLAFGASTADMVESQDERLQEARQLIGGWLAYIKAGVQDSSSYAALVGDSAIWLKRADA